MKFFRYNSSYIRHHAMMSILALAAFTSCSDDLDVNEGVKGGVFDGTITLNVSIPDATVVATRSIADDEKTISGSHYALIYQKGENDKYTLLRAPETINLNGVTSQVSLSVSKSLDLDNLKIVVVANLNSSEAASIANLAVGSSLTEGLISVNTVTSTLVSNTQPEKPFVMSATAVEGTTSGSFTVDLQRTVAKVSIQSSASNFTLSEYTMYNAPSNGYLAAYVGNENGKNIFVIGTNNYVVNVKDDDGLYNYSYPVKSAGKITDNHTGAYFVVKGEFDGEECYYRVDLRNDNDASSDYYDLLPNHWYQVEITEVKRKGYPTYAEAAKRYMGQEEDPALKVKIHDHVANVLSMTTDGIRELGVTKNVIMASSGGVFTVKVFSSSSQKATEEVFSAENIKILDGSDWLQIGSLTEKTSENPLADNHTDPDDPLYSDQNGPQIEDGGASTSGNDADSKGRRWEVELKIKDGVGIYNDKTATLEINWCGLTRQVEVTYNADFRPEDACKASISYALIGGVDGVTHEGESKYWDFLKNWVKGINANDMADGKVRNEGLHFPMPYGEPGKQWEYIYTLDFSPIDNKPYEITGINVSTSGSNFFKDNIKAQFYFEGSKPVVSVSLKNPKQNDFTYAVGTISFTIKYNQGDDRVLSMSLYHTGFFDYDSGGTNACIYYEVVNLGGKYWLDRNLGATSNKMYVDYGDGSEAGNPDAKGLFYKIANAGNTSSQSPKMTYSSLCPKGYEVPNATDWDAVRLSPNFQSSQLTDPSSNANYVSTYYAAGGLYGNVYFPKARYYNNGSNLTKDTDKSSEANSGDSGSGYYWTTTMSSGLEKAETAAWLKALNLTGSSNTYISSSIKQHELNVRCVAAYSHMDDVKKDIEFNVKGATHVYLYSYDSKGNRSGLFTFPGKAIGSQATVDGLNYSDVNSFLHFSYSSTIEKDKLRVFFVYKADDGEITIISRNGKQNLDEATGWPVEVGYNYFFTKANANPAFEPVPGGDKNEFPWPASGTSENTPTYDFVAGKTVTIYWPQKISNQDMWHIYVWGDFLTKEPTGKFPGTRTGYIKKNEAGYPYSFGDQAYYYTFKLDSSVDEFYVVCNADSSSCQTDNITISKSNTTQCSITDDGSGGYKIILNNLTQRNK